jgi:hypothetical protein
MNSHKVMDEVLAYSIVCEVEAVLATRCRAEGGATNNKASDLAQQAAPGAKEATDERAKFDAAIARADQPGAALRAEIMQSAALQQRQAPAQADELVTRESALNAIKFVAHSNMPGRAIAAAKTLVSAQQAEAAPAPTTEPVAWKVGNLLTMSDSDYPGMGSMFAQVWEGDDLIARVYGDSADEVRTRAARIASPAAHPANTGEAKWKPVPLTPTREMLEAAQALDGGDDDIMAAWANAYGAMLDAAPSPVGGSAPMPCGACGGSGKYAPDSTDECEECKGTGTVNATTREWQ